MRYILHVVAQLFLLSKITSQAEEVCYKELGCFSNEEPWTSTLRPLPLPQSPAVVKVDFLLYTRNNPTKAEKVKTWPSIRMKNSAYNGKKKTLLFVHGWASSANVSYYTRIKDAVLRNVDGNLILVDWGYSSRAPYDQACSNIRVVAAQIERFLKYLIDKKGASPSRFHLMGHSLGAHTVAYVAKNIPGVAKVTGLDPAQPFFEGAPPEVRLDADDANFVEVAHTNGRPFVPLLGLGMSSEIGDVDFYFNGGWTQPGCTQEATEATVKSLFQGGSFIQDLLSSNIACSHSRAVFYFIEAIESRNCTFWGKRRDSTSKVINNLSAGWLSRTTIDPSDCTLSSCTAFGLNTQKFPARGAFSVATRTSSPYCEDHREVDVSMTRQLKSREKVTSRTNSRLRQGQKTKV